VAPVGDASAKISRTRHPSEEQPAMSTQIPSQSPGGVDDRVSPWAVGLAVFAAAMMIVNGIIQVFVAISALFNDNLYVATPQYVYAFDLTTWGWVHLLLGALLVIAGLAVIKGQTWARVVGIALACLSIIANFMFLPHYPIWSILIIALDVAVIWALAVYHGE
jgi:hypothetical protein